MTDKLITDPTIITALSDAGLATDAELASATSHSLSGTGSPEGVVTAPVGTHYTDLARTLGARTWVKNGGVGNTGWIVVEGDSGRRDVSASLMNGWTGTLILRRQNGHVQLAGSLDGSAATSNITYTIPFGFRPDQNLGPAVAPILGEARCGYNATFTTAATPVQGGGGADELVVIQRGSINSVTTRDFVINWLSADAWQGQPGVAA